MLTAGNRSYSSAKSILSAAKNFSMQLIRDFEDLGLNTHGLMDKAVHGIL